MSTRRGILGIIAAAPVAVPVMAQELAKSNAASGLGAVGRQQIGSYNGINEVMSQGSGWDSNAIVKAAYKSGAISKSQLLDCLMPSHPLGTPALDPDLASARSFSLSARYAMQRERERDKAWAHFFDDSPRYDLWDMARKLSGLDKVVP